MIVFDPRRIDAPRPGYFMVRLAKYGPWVPARLDEELRPHLRGRLWEPMFGQSEQDLIDRIWLWGREIDQETHDRMAAAYERAMRDAPESVTANPDRQYPPGKIPLRSLMP